MLKGEDARPSCPASRCPTPPEADVASSPTPPSGQGTGTAPGRGVAPMPGDGPCEAPFISAALSSEPGENAPLVSLSFHFWEN